MSVIENVQLGRLELGDQTRFWRQVPHSWEGVQYAVDRLLNGVIGAYQREPARCTKTAERNDTVELYTLLDPPEGARSREIGSSLMTSGQFTH